MFKKTQNIAQTMHINDVFAKNMVKYYFFYWNIKFACLRCPSHTPTPEYLIEIRTREAVKASGTSNENE